MVIIRSLLHFTVAGFCEMGGGFLIWLWLKLKENISVTDQANWKNWPVSLWHNCYSSCS
jgi:drug/metabolite transporter superfamily protein YnfA